jgi:hypothetical protein
MKPVSHQTQAELDFEFGLPAGREAFSVGFLAKWFNTSVNHWINQIERGALPAVNCASPGTTKSMWRISRQALVAYLRKNHTHTL